MTFRLGFKLPHLRPVRRKLTFRTPAWRVLSLDPGRLLAALFGGGLAVMLAGGFLLVGLYPLVKDALWRALAHRR
ncbi:MAG: hypothetical protein ACM3RP_07235 [Chitinophagales bacterium]